MCRCVIVMMGWKKMSFLDCRCVSYMQKHMVPFCRQSQRRDRIQIWRWNDVNQDLSANDITCILCWISTACLKMCKSRRMVPKVYITCAPHSHASVLLYSAHFRASVIFSWFISEWILCHTYTCTSFNLAGSLFTFFVYPSPELYMFFFYIPATLQGYKVMLFLIHGFSLCLGWYYLCVWSRKARRWSVLYGWQDLNTIWNHEDVAPNNTNISTQDLYAQHLSYDDCVMWSRDLDRFT